MCGLASALTRHVVGLLSAICLLISGKYAIIYVLRLA